MAQSMMFPFEGEESPLIVSFQGSQASIVKVAGAGFRLSLLLNAAACQLAQSRLEIHSIAKGISLFALTLKHVGQSIEAVDIDHSPEATEKAWEIAGQGQIIFIEIEHMLDKLKATDRNEDLMRLPLQERLKWCFPKQHVTYLLAQLESLKLSLIVMLRILQLGNVIKANIDDGIDTDSLASAADDAVAQEKAESQNMIIVRYWSVKRLDRLWDLVEQEAMDFAKDPTNQKINANYTNTASAVKPLAAATRGSDPTRLPAVTFGTSDVDLSDMERSPKDMVQLSERAMNRLLAIWVPIIDASRLRPTGEAPNSSNKLVQPRVYVSDTDDYSDELDFDGHDVRGYYLEGKTDDWRNPHSQGARQHAAKLRQEYSRYQAHVESEPETDSKRGDRQRALDSSDEERDILLPHTTTNPMNMHTRPHSSSLSSGYPTDNRQYPYPGGSFPPPTQRPPQPSNQPHPNQYRYNEYPTPRSMPKPNQPIPIQIPKQAPSMPTSRGHSPNQVHFEHWNRPHKLQPRHPSAPYPLSTSSPESRISPPRSAQRSPSHHRSREEAKERHKALTRNATRGLVGIGAIAGFMDALEAFSIL
jgi:hypothetical protein